MTACGGILIGGEISRNEQCPHQADLRRLRLRIAQALASFLFFSLHNMTLKNLEE